MDVDRTTIAHLYRAQVQRADMWRARLDSTTNWSVVSTAAALTISFSEPRSGPIVLAITTLIITLFLWIESRRYRYFELWSLRVRLLEHHYFAPLLSDTDEREPERWRSERIETLETQGFPISRSEAFGRRYRSVYIWLHGILALSWVAHVWRFPRPADHWSELWQRSLVGDISIAWALLFGVVFQASLFAIGMVTSRLKEARGEVF